LASRQEIHELSCTYHEGGMKEAWRRYEGKPVQTLVRLEK